MWVACRKQGWIPWPELINSSSKVERSKKGKWGDGGRSATDGEKSCSRTTSTIWRHSLPFPLSSPSLPCHSPTTTSPPTQLCNPVPQPRYVQTELARRFAVCPSASARISERGSRAAVARAARTGWGVGQRDSLWLHPVAVQDGPAVRIEALAWGRPIDHSTL